MTREFCYDSNSPHCRECLCKTCTYFWINDGGECVEGCGDCNGKSHIERCLMFEEEGELRL